MSLHVYYSNSPPGGSVHPPSNAAAQGYTENIPSVISCMAHISRKESRSALRQHLQGEDLQFFCCYFFLPATTKRFSVS